MILKLTKEQIQWFWEQCGLKKTVVKVDGIPVVEAWVYPDRQLHNDAPPIDLNNLFKYAVSIWIGRIMAEQECSSDVAYAVVFKKWLQELELNIPHAATSLFKAIYKAVGGKV